MTTLEANRRRMVSLLADLATGEGLRPSILDGVKLGRASRGSERAPVLYESCLYIVASGRKIGFLGDRRFVYDPNNYLVLSAPLPFECRTEAEADRAFEALARDGQIQMPIGKTFFSPRFGCVADKFGVSWMVMVPQPM